MIEKLMYLFVILIALFILSFPIILIIKESKYTKSLIDYMEYSLGRRLTQREKDQITYRFNPMYRAYWMDELEKSYMKGVVFKIPPSKERMR